MANGNAIEERDFYDEYRKIPFGLLPKPSSAPVLENLLKAMRAPRQQNGGIEPALNEKIPAGFTYFGQFITHDISPERGVKPEERIDFKPTLRLDSLYGNRPDAQPFLYAFDLEDMPHQFLSKAFRDLSDEEKEKRFGGALMRLKAHRNRKETPDVEREEKKDGQAPSDKMATLRNDRNYILLQWCVALISFHNAVAEYLNEEDPTLTGDTLFKETEKEVIWHYQWLVVHQYLPMLVGKKLVDELLQGEEKFRFFKIKPQDKDEYEAPRLMPEFSGAAFRIGHSQVREIYVFPKPKDQQTLFNKTFKRPIFLDAARDAMLDEKREELLKLDAAQQKKKDGLSPYFLDLQERGDLRGEIKRDSNELVMDWKFFFDFGTNSNHIPQASLAIDHNIIEPLFDLFFLKKREREASLPKRDIRSSVELAAGYAVYLAYMIENPDDSEVSAPLTTEEVRKAMGMDDLRVSDLPLSVYLLLEAEIRNNGERLGPLGSRIIGEQIIWMLLADKDSFLNQKKNDDPDWKWTPRKKFTEWRKGKNLDTSNTSPLTPEAQQFGIVDMLQFTETFTNNKNE